ncbi:sigma-70 family RNA polymerase sigma factor [Paraburkholderia sp.]|uniref:sigma-70 family RNA polymerase sigma factor n=1 Tax=Paraburkholderia sp. TaxID=1926495 RepID=UPI003D6EBD52
MGREPTPLHKLYAEHHGWLVGWLRRRLGNSDQAADLAQDTFVKLVVDRETQPLDQPRAYLATIARRLLIDQTRRHTLERAYLETLAAQPVGHVPSEEAKALVLESLRQIDAILQKLAEPVRAAFLLSQLDGLTYEEIAGRLSVSTRTVKRYMATAFEECLCAMYEV